MRKRISPEIEKKRKEEYKKNFNIEYFKKRFTEETDKQNITFVSIAELLGVDAQTVQRWSIRSGYNMKTPPKMEYVKQIAKLLTVPFESLYNPNYIIQQELWEKQVSDSHVKVENIHNKYQLILKLLTDCGMDFTENDGCPSIICLTDDGEFELTESDFEKIYEKLKCFVKLFIL